MLNCMATYRREDKKSLDNTMKKPMSLSNLSTTIQTGGDTINPVKQANDIVNRIARHNNASLSLAKVNSSIAMTTSNRRALGFVGAISAKTGGTSVPSAFVVDPIGMGRLFAPLSGNWH